MANEDSVYTGKISNAGAQVVKAPITPKGEHKAPTVVKGGDLRSK